MIDTIQQQLTRARRNQILDAATELFAEQGFNKTTVRKVAQRAGVADGTIYNYFKSKNDLLLGIMRRLNESELRDLDFEPGQAQTLAQFLPAYLEKRMVEVSAYSAALRAILPQLLVNEGLREQMNAQTIAPTYAVSNQFFSDLMAQGDLRDLDPTLVSNFVLIVVSGFMMPLVYGEESADPTTLKQLSETLSDLILNGIGHHEDINNEKENA